MRKYLVPIALAALTGACAGGQVKGGSYEEVYASSYSKGYDAGFQAGLQAGTGGGLGIMPAPYQGSALTQAIQAGRVEEVERLLEEDPSSASEVDNMGYSPLHYAARAGRTDVISMLLKAGADIGYKASDGFTPLKEAVVGNRLEAAALLIEAGARVDTVDNLGVGLVQNAVEVGNVGMLELLAEAGGDVNQPNNAGQPPLISAALFGLVPMVGCLAEHGAALEAKDSATGRTALAWAVSYGNLAMVKSLLDAGAEADATDIYGNTPLLEAVAVSRNDIVSMLLEAGADPDAVSTSASTMGTGGYPYMGNPYGMLGGVITSYPQDGTLLGKGRRPAHVAALLGNMAVLKMLLDRKADLNAEDYGGSTPADLASKAGHSEIVGFLEKNAPSKKKSRAGAGRKKGYPRGVAGMKVRHVD